VEQYSAAVLPLLTIPIAVGAAVKTVYVAFKNKTWRLMLPLFFTQLITIFIWTCLGSVQLGYFRVLTSGQKQVHGSDFKDQTIRHFLTNTVFLDPVNIFLYTW